MPRKKIPQRRIKYLKIPDGKLIHKPDEPAKLKSFEKKYKNLRIARFDDTYYKSHKLKMDLKQKSMNEINKIDDGLNEKIVSIGDDQKKIEIINQKNEKESDQSIDHINIKIENKFDYFFSTLTQNIEEDFDQEDAFDSWNQLY